MRGNDFLGHGVRDKVTIKNGTKVSLCFCFKTFALAEEIYTDVFKRQGDVLEIIDALINNEIPAMLSLLYAAAVAAGEDVTIESFIEAVSVNVSDINGLYAVTVKNLNRMFREKTGSYPHNTPDSETGATNEFPWDIYYRAALTLGMSEAEFWAATPRKIWLLTRDKDEEELSERLTNQYI